MRSAGRNVSPVLMIAYHFPPAAMGSGHLRTLGFARYLPAFGWDPIVLSARSLAYPRTAPMNGEAIPPGCRVSRSLAFDARRHFGVGGKYPGFLAQPDRWASWWPSAVLQGLRIIRRQQVRAIWSTYPIMTAHCIARTLSRVSGLPWIADFRDPVKSSAEAGNAFSVASQQRWEPRILHGAARVTFTTPGALRVYTERYPDVAGAGRLGVIANGYDETAFVDLPEASPPLPGRPLVMVHSGLLYAEGRNPVPFLAALARLRIAGSISADNLKIVLRASGNEPAYAQEIQRMGLEGMVVLAPPVSNREALVEQATADALLLFQGHRFDRQVPAKLYEYLRIGRPIFALVGGQGDTAAILRDVGGAAMVAEDDIAAIEVRLREFIVALREGRAAHPRAEVIAGFSRREGAKLLAGLLDQAVAKREELPH